MKIFRKLLPLILCGLALSQNAPNPPAPAITLDATGHLTWWNGSKWMQLANAADVPTATSATPPKPATLVSSPLFPGAAWTLPVDTTPIDSAWTASWAAQFGTTKLHSDFGQSPYGIPVNVVNSKTDAVTWTAIAIDNPGEAYPDESDNVPVPLLAAPQIEPGSDGHLIVFDAGTGLEYDAYKASHDAKGWHCGSLARFDTRSSTYPQRPIGWTSADAAGLPIYPLLTKPEDYDPAKPDFGHALRLTMDWMRPAFYANGDGVPAIILPATHGVNTNNGGESGSAAIMGLRLRLRASFDETPYSGWALAFVRTAKRYGFIIADVGSRGYVSGTLDTRWTDLPTLNISLGDLEAIQFKAYTTTATIDQTQVRADLAGKVFPSTTLSVPK